jgi:hypothetical protein
MNIHFALVAFGAALTAACGGSTSSPAGPDDASPANGSDASTDSGLAMSSDSGVDTTSDAGPDSGSDSSAPSTCGVASVTGSCTPFGAAVVAATTGAGGALELTIADSQESACTPNTGQSVNIFFPPGAAAGTLNVVALADGGAPPAGDVAVAYTMMFPQGGGTSPAQSGTVTLTSLTSLGATGSFDATFATTACMPLTLSGTFSALASCACP